MKKDIQIFLGVQIYDRKYVADKWFSIDLYNNAKDQKAYLGEALDHVMEKLKDELKKKDLI